MNKDFYYSNVPSAKKWPRLTLVNRIPINSRIQHRAIYQIVIPTWRWRLFLVREWIRKHIG